MDMTLVEHQAVPLKRKPKCIQTELETKWNLNWILVETELETEAGLRKPILNP
jgi:hypothetical protein